jgi:hypothetical protein
MERTVETQSLPQRVVSRSDRDRRGRDGVPKGLREEGARKDAHARNVAGVAEPRSN